MTDAEREFWKGLIEAGEMFKQAIANVEARDRLLKPKLKNGGQLLTDLRYNKLEGERPGSLRPNGTP